MELDETRYLPLQTDDFLSRTEFTADLQLMQESVAEIERRIAGRTDPVYGQLALMHRPGSPDPLHESLGTLWNYEKRDYRAEAAAFSQWNEELKGTYLYRVYLDLQKVLPFPIVRGRIMYRQPKTCYSIHNDTEPRLHFAIHTNPGAFALSFDGDKGVTHQLPADGHLYFMNALKMHTYINAGQTVRTHLVFSALHPDMLLRKGLQREHLAPQELVGHA